MKYMKPLMEVAADVSRTIQTAVQDPSDPHDCG